MSNETTGGYTPIDSLGEFPLIDHITRNFPDDDQRVVKGVGDDAAVIDLGQDMLQIVTTDMLLEGVHFDLAYVPLRHLGYKAVVANLSDIAAMNGVAYGITVSVAMSNRFTVEAIDELFAGIRLACEKYKINLLGGDTSSSKQGLVISVTALGTALPANVVYRSGAQVNDLICVSGDIGGAYAGLLVLDREKSVFAGNPELQPDLTDYDYVVGRQLKPEARFDILGLLREKEVQPSSMMDISDGVASELHHMCKQSQTGAKIFANKLPLDYQTVKVAEEFKIGPATFALNGGEDYELIFTVPVKDFDKIKQVAEISVIGHMTSEKGLVEMVLEDGSVAEIEALGWQHFSAEGKAPGEKQE